MLTGLYGFGEYIKILLTLFQQIKVNVSFPETVHLITTILRDYHGVLVIALSVNPLTIINP